MIIYISFYIFFLNAFLIKEFFPLDNAISIFALPFLFINKRKGMIYSLFFNLDSILLSSSLFNNNFRLFFEYGCLSQHFVVLQYVNFLYTVQIVKSTKASERLALLFLIDFISVPNKAIPALYFVSI